MIALRAVERDLVIVTCAVSAGVHGALAPEHFAEGTGAGAGFVVSAVLLAGAAAVLTVRASTPALVATCALLASLGAAYALSVTAGIPLVHPEPESIDAFALATKAVEGLGLLAAAHLLWRDSPFVPTLDPRTKGLTT